MRCPRCFRRYQDEDRFCQYDGQRLVEFIDLDRLGSKASDRTGWVVADRYRVHGLLGRGSMAEVFLARDVVNGDPVAVKVLSSRHLKDPRIRARMLLEAKACARITHPNVVKLLDVGLAEGTPFIVMEYLFGESLGERLRRDDVLKPDLGVPILRQIASGLAAAHEVGVVHRDIKADNVFLVGDKRDPYIAKIVDFGLAKDPEHTNLTQVGVALGTLEYMAPEQTVGDRPDPRTDIYALGVLMYRMFSGRLPFRERAPPDLLARQLASAPHPPYFGKTQLERNLALICLKALRKRREHRYPSMGALIEDLDDASAAAGPQHAAAPIVQPDEYVPETPFSQRAAEIFRRRARNLH